MGYKGKKIEKTLLISDYIIDVSEKEMKVVQVENVKYVIQDKDDLINVTHELAYKGYSALQIAQFLGISEKTVIKYLGDCW